MICYCQKTLIVMEILNDSTLRYQTLGKIKKLNLTF